MAKQDAAAWRLRRSLARVEAVDQVLADYAASWVGLPVRRRDLPWPQHPSVTWSIDNEVMVELLHHDSGPDRLLVHEVALLQPLRKRLRSRHTKIDYVPRG